MPDQETARLISDQNRRILALENRLASLETKFIPPDRQTAGTELARIAAALNQLGPVLLSCDLLAARAAAPASPWKPI